MRINLTKPLREAPAERPIRDEDLVPIRCNCEHADHGAHHVAARRLRKGGDLRGKVEIDPSVAEKF